jgi:uncharacterized protein YciI
MTTTYRPNGKEQLYVAFYRLAPNPPKLKGTAEELQAEHRAWLQNLADQHILAGSGPSKDENDKAVHGAVMLFRLPNLAAAEKLAKEEPIAREGQRIPTVMPWHRMWFEEEGPTTKTVYKADKKQQLFVALYRMNPEAPGLGMMPDELHNQHRDWLKGLATRGILVGSGPARDETGKNHAGAVMIFRVGSTEEAEKLAKQEPNAREKQRIPEVWPWQRMWFEE